MEDKITFGAKYAPAMKITDAEKAQVYFEECVLHAMRTSNVSRAEAESAERTNIVYFSGYYDGKTRERVKRLFGGGM